MHLILALLLAQSGLSEEKARQILPRADLHALTDAQRAQFLEIAGDTFDYAGCNDTLARCLGADVNDKHALRMADLVKGMLLEGYTPSVIIEQAERYYASFPAQKRQKLLDTECPQLGDPKSPVAVVEFSDFQCPFCAAVTKPLHDLVDAMPGKVRLCSKYFPLPMHPQSHQAAGCAEYARQHGKFWEMGEYLYGHQDELDDAHLKQYAAALKLDGAEMLKQVYGGQFDAIIEKQKKEGTDAGVKATPTLFFNGRQYTLPFKAEFFIFSAQDEEEWQRNKGWDRG
ncbi:MAG TPA: DsbA family protein [Myxococcales bacterium]|nr:DsbA family protein [Myxococcales bacterium]